MYACIVMARSDEPIGSFDAARKLLSALERQLNAAGSRFDLVVIGGSALLAQGLVGRATEGIDVVALATPHGLVSAVDLPPALLSAAERVGRDLDSLQAVRGGGPSRQAPSGP
jgi:hypothetical protein